MTGPEQWWATEEADEVRAAEEEIDVLCHEFQALYDATMERVVLSDVPWIPPEMKEAVQIDVGCEQ